MEILTPINPSVRHYFGVALYGGFLTFSDVDLDFTEVEVVDVAGCRPLDANKSAPDRRGAWYVG